MSHCFWDLEYPDYPILLWKKSATLIHHGLWHGIVSDYTRDE